MDGANRQTASKQSDFTRDFTAGLKAMNDLPQKDRGNLLAIASIMLKHLGPHVKSVKLTGSRHEPERQH